VGILISDAAGSKELVKDISKRPGHPEVELCDMSTMPYGDCMIPFLGPPVDTPMMIGVEFKKLGDVLACITSGRYAGHQLVGCAETYDLSMLLIEGQWRMNRQTGVLESLSHVRGKYEWRSVSSGPRKWMYREFNRWMMTMGLVGGVQIWFTRDRDETVQTLIDIHAIGQKKWDAHDTLKAHSNVTVDQLHYRTMPDGSRRMQFETPTMLQRIAIQLPGIGVDRAREVAKHFKTAGNLGDNWRDEKLWRGIEGIGKGIAKKIVQAVDEEEQ